VFGEELVDPRAEGHFLDPGVTLGSDKDRDNCDVGLLTMDALLIGFAIGSSRVVGETNIMGGIGTPICNQIIKCFLFHFRPGSVSKHKNVLNFIRVGVADSASFAAAKFSKEFLCVRKINELF